MKFDPNNPRSVRLWREVLESDFLMFCRFFFKVRLSYKMKINPHHVLMARTMERVFNGDIKRLIINVPPGYTKTEMCVIMFIAWSMAKRPKSKFIHVTYADTLVLENSLAVRDTIMTEEYQAMWPMDLRQDSKSKSTWKNTSGGGLNARPAGGQITGLRAGQPDGDFSGAFIVDDPIKPDDRNSEKIVNNINARFNGTFRSRLMQERNTPMIVIMQRIAENDPSGFLLKGGTGEMWHHLSLPVMISSADDNGNPVEAPKQNTHARIIPHNLPDGPLWDFKHDESEIESLRIDPFTFSAQYMQNPSPLGGGIFKESWWRYYPMGGIRFERRVIFVDTAQKTKEANDYSCFQCWGEFENNIYLIDLIKGKWEAPELLRRARLFWNKHYGTGLARTTGRLEYMGIEDKSSGTGLIQQLADPIETSDIRIPVVAIPRHIDKLTRAQDAVPYIHAGRVLLPEGADFVLDYVSEFSLFSSDDSHLHDDQVDPTLDAISNMLGEKQNKGGVW